MNNAWSLSTTDLYLTGLSATQDEDSRIFLLAMYPGHAIPLLCEV